MIEVPTFVVPVLETLLLSDYDTSRPRCGEALRWLSDRGLVTKSRGARIPVWVTVPGRELGKALGFEGHAYT